jgi:hypothetical protein
MRGAVGSRRKPLVFKTEYRKEKQTVNKFVYFNDTGRIVSIHPATLIHGCKVNGTIVLPNEEKVFELPEGTYPWVKMWDYGEKYGLSILVSPQREE